MSRALRDVAVVALGGIALCFFAGCGGTGPTPTSEPKYQDRAEAAARYFLEHYVNPDGRVVRHDQGNDTVSEGQAYGMLIAAAIGDARTFDAIWAWTQANLRRLPLHKPAKPDSLHAPFNNKVTNHKESRASVSDVTARTQDNERPQADVSRVRQASQLGVIIRVRSTVRRSVRRPGWLRRTYNRECLRRSDERFPRVGRQGR